MKLSFRDFLLLVHVVIVVVGTSKLGESPQFGKIVKKYFGMKL